MVHYMNVDFTPLPPLSIKTYLTEYVCGKHGYLIVWTVLFKTRLHNRRFHRARL